jgi:hypothetical protein
VSPALVGRFIHEEVWETYVFRLIDHGRDNVLWASDALVEGAAVELLLRRFAFLRCGGRFGRHVVERSPASCPCPHREETGCEYEEGQNDCCGGEWGAPYFSKVVSSKLEKSIKAPPDF